MTTVKARERQGARSLDLTIPTRVIDAFDVRAGDVFTVTTIKQNSTDNQFTIEYRRVFANKN